MSIKPQEQEQKQTETTTAITETETTTALRPDAIYKNNIYALVDDLKNDNQFKGLTDEEIKNNKAFFPRLIDLIYDQYIGDLLGNKEYTTKVIYPDIDILNNIFNIYTQLVYMYKWNNRPSLVEFSLLVGISTDTFYRWLKNDNNNTDINTDNNINDNRVSNNTDNTDNNIINKGKQDKRRHITARYADAVRKWQTVSERALTDGNGEYVKEIFLLKSKHGYKEQDSSITVNVNHKQIISSDDLPALIGLNGNN